MKCGIVTPYSNLVEDAVSIQERLNRLEVEKVLLQQEVAALKAKQEDPRLPLPTFEYVGC